jgi:nitrite reductase (NADH) small subunit
MTIVDSAQTRHTAAQQPATAAVPVCALADLTPDLGVAALIDGEQVAVFLLADGSVHCVQNLDPFSGAHVMSRGITGSRGAVPTIASPLYKQVFSLLDGTCLAPMDKSPKAGVSPHLRVYPVAVVDSLVCVGLLQGA